MRETKFRAWDKNKKEWMKDTFLINCDGQTIIVFPDGKTKEQYALFIGTDVDVFQYTGLKDKNGVEVYEGDVIGFPNKNIVAVVKFGEYNFLGDEYGDSGIGFYLERYSFGIKEEQAQGIYDFPGSFHAVIGNIYENPELLK